MDDILQRMLAVEKEADRLLAAAEKEAEAILAAGQQEATELEAKKLQEINTEEEALVSGRVAAAESAREKTLTESRQRQEQRLASLRDRLSAAQEFVTQTLAMPQP